MRERQQHSSKACACLHDIAVSQNMHGSPVPGTTEASIERSEDSWHGGAHGLLTWPSQTSGILQGNKQF